MAEVVICCSLTTKAWACIQVSQHRICGGQNGTGTGFSPSFLVSPSISFHHGSPYLYITWGMNNRRLWLQFSDIVSPHWYEQQQKQKQQQLRE
jgi:hypothetical protein